MRRTQFLDKWSMNSMDVDTKEFLLLIASFMSDIQETTTDPKVINKLNVLKKFVFDYQEVLSAEQSPVCQPCSYDGVWSSMSV